MDGGTWSPPISFFSRRGWGNWRAMDAAVHAPKGPLYEAFKMTWMTCQEKKKKRNPKAGRRDGVLSLVKWGGRSVIGKQQTRSPQNGPKLQPNNLIIHDDDFSTQRHPKEGKQTRTSLRNSTF